MYRNRLEATAFAPLKPELTRARETVAASAKSIHLIVCNCFLQVYIPYLPTNKNVDKWPLYKSFATK
jgi:hypothetical protein